MAISAAVYSVVVRKDAVENKMDGGIAALEASCPNSTFCTDGRLCRIGFMAFDDAAQFVGQLEMHGLDSVVDGHAVDIAILSETKGCLSACDWLEFGHFEGRPIAWLKGTDPDPLIITKSEFETQANVFQVSPEQLATDFEFVETRDGVSSYRRRQTGQTVYIGRPAIRKQRWWKFWR